MSRWGDPQTVAGFSRSLPNPTLLRFVESEIGGTSRPRLLDLGCGAGRNAVPIAALGCQVLGTDIERPMLEAASQRARAAGEMSGRRSCGPDARPAMVAWCGNASKYAST